MQNTFWSNLSFDHVEGDITPVKSPGDTGWRQLPYWVIVVPVDGGSSIDTHGHGKLFCKAGHAVLCPPNLPHRFSSPAGQDYISYWSHIRFTLPGAIDVADFLETPLIVPPPASDRIGQINAELADLTKKNLKTSLKFAGRYLELGFTLFSIICSVSREKDESCLFSPKAGRIRELLLFIDRHLHEELDRDRLAERFGLSPARFHVVFQQIVGMGPMGFIKRQRMKKAQVLLAETQRSIKAIGESVGYTDAYTFSRAFKNTVGISPQNYRIRSRKSFMTP
jgi:AraC-like DNA-binding protein